MFEEKYPLDFILNDYGHARSKSFIRNTIIFTIINLFFAYEVMSNMIYHNELILNKWFLLILFLSNFMFFIELKSTDLILESVLFRRDYFEGVIRAQEKGNESNFKDLDNEIKLFLDRVTINIKKDINFAKLFWTGSLITIVIEMLYIIFS